MSYIKREWATGNVVGAVDLNRMEQGIEDSRGILVVNSVYNESDNSFTLNKTWQEIYDAFPFVIEYCNANGAEVRYIIGNIGITDNDYIVYGSQMFSIDSANGYPTSGSFV